VIRGTEKAQSPGEDAVYLMQIIDAVYESIKSGCQIDFGD